MTSQVQPTRSRAITAPLEPRYLQHREQAFSLSLLLFASFLLLSSPLSCEVRSASAQTTDRAAAKLATYQAIFELIDSYYVEERHLGGIIDSIMLDVLGKLDPHTYYSEPAAAERRAAYYQGEEYRFGFSYDYYDGRPVITYVIPNSSAANAGLLPGDNVNVLWGQPIETLTEEEIDQLIGGERLEMIVTRLGGKKRTMVKMGRQPLYGKSVQIAEMLDHITGYIYLSGFIATSYYEMKRALEDMTAGGMKKLILDLRGNGGGLLKQANEVAGLFLPFHSRLAGYRGKGDTAITYDTSFMPGRFTDLELVVLIDGGSASSSEIVAGILQDHDRALIVGEQSYGKGLYQRIFDLPDGGSFTLTMGHFYLPSGRCTQRPYQGSTVTVPRMPLAYGDNNDHAKDTSIYWDGKYQTASGRAVYGGQGIIPEVIVKYDTTSSFIVELRKSDAFERLMDTVLNLNAELLTKKYPDVATFVKQYEAKPEALPLFTKFANKLGIKNAGLRIEQQKKEVLIELKRWMAYRLFPENGWMRSALINDKQLQKAIKQLEQQFVLK